MKKSKNNILLSAGGTGGHLFPAESLATEFIARNDNVFFATDKRGEAFYKKSSLQDNTQVNMHVLPSATWGKGIIGKFSALFTMGIGVLKSIVLLKKNKVDAVVGFGGYPSFPAVYAAQLLGIPTILHEQNAILGKANAKLAVKASHIALPLEGTKGIDKYTDKITVTGNPIRKEVFNKSASEPNKFNDDEILEIFVMGGSQGAKILGDVIPKAIARLPIDIQKRINLVMQCREEQLESTRSELSKLEINFDLKEFFTDAAEKLEKCHLFIGRSGASTVADVTVVGRPAIFVPMKHADMQQKLNADIVANSGGAWVMMEEDFTAADLAKKIQEFFASPEILEKAAKLSAKCGKNNAVETLGDCVYKVLNRTV